MTLAVITGASTGIGLELARVCAAEGHDVIVLANEPAIHQVATELNGEAVEADLATPEGNEALLATIAEREVDLLLVNAGTGLGHGFLEQPLDGIERTVLTNVMSPLRLVHPLANAMVARGEGRILLTGSIAGFMPGTYQAVYNATKAFINSFAGALAHELKGTGVTVTCLMPGATETEFFRRAGMDNTIVGDMKKDDPAWVARHGYEALMAGREQVTPGVLNKLQAAAGEHLPAGVVAEAHRRLSKPRD
ncbi:SDR family NAD(P)-dependent oxidoreductase [Falsirhodobacter halotolerans]|uniref:SDR family NAD(P)-dependent oxidoreductase n=1 Tax=Falsirhodobacter halotolerans TaxID=1146892 RepID=UPI001FD0CE03|nr:SDR family NAD(P)-dependent oxidoreductase [Falsirhodobacter halotolerans]MCJ8139971.1 SDR family NAD(P)-dependent oxidoreductase [Falsirhodobacter halotolerans]